MEVLPAERRIHDRRRHLLRLGADVDLVLVAGWRHVGSSGPAGDQDPVSRPARRPTIARVNGSAYLLIQRSATIPMGTGFR